MSSTEALGSPFATPPSSAAHAAEYARLTAEALRIESRQLARRAGVLIALIIMVGLALAGSWIAASAALGYWAYASGVSALVAILSVAAANGVFGLLLILAAFRLAKNLGFPVTQSLLARLKEVIPHE